MRRNSLIFGLCLWGFFQTAVVFSYDRWPSDVSDSDYPAAAGKKLGRGVANLGFGWLDFFKGIEAVGNEQNTIAALTWGPIYGLSNAVARTAAGAYEVVTFPVPSEPVVEPEFVLDDKT